MSTATWKGPLLASLVVFAGTGTAVQAQDPRGFRLAVRARTAGGGASDVDRALTEDRKSAMSAGIPAGRVGQPDDVAALVAFLTSHEAGFVNGASYFIDGGKHMV